MAQSSSSSGIFFEGDGQSQDAGNSNLSSKFVNASNLLPGHACGDMDPVSRDVGSNVLNSVANSGLSFGASSLVTDANSGFLGGPPLRRSASVNTDSYMCLPASPMSFSSNNISISGSSVVDGSSTVQQSSSQDPGSQVQQSQQHLGGSSATSLPNSYVQGQTIVSQPHKKPRLDIEQKDVQQQVLQQLLRRQDSILLHHSNPQLQALIQQQKLRQQEQQIVHAMPAMQRAQLLQQQQQLQLIQQLQVQGMLPTSAIKQPYETGVCTRRLMQYLYHQRQRPAENTNAYWRKFVAEYYSPRAKKRWCLSMYNNVRQHSLGVFPRAAKDAWQCDLCGSKSGRGFETSFEVLPRLNEIKFGSGVINELLYLDLPHECRFLSGMMMLEYGKAIEESIYEQLRVVREGQLRVFFTPDLKILSWEFCARRHEELLPRRLVAPQVNQLLQIAQKCQSMASEGGADGVSQQHLQANNAMVVMAGRQLARSLEPQFLNDLGFLKRFVQCLQIADVVNSMKDLMDFCRQQKKGPIEGLKAFPRSVTAVNTQMQKPQEMNRFEGVQGLPTDRNALSKLMALRHPWLVGQMNSGQVSPAFTNVQNLLMRQNSMNLTNKSVQQDASSPFSNASPSLSSATSQSLSTLPETLQNSPATGFFTCQAPQQQELQLQHQHLPSQGDQGLQQRTIQQLLQDTSKKNTNRVIPPQHPLRGQNPSGNVSVSSLGLRNGAGQLPSSRINSFKSVATSSESPALADHIGFSQKAPDLPQALRLSDEMVPDIIREFTEYGLFNSDLDENMNFSWKGMTAENLN